MRNNGMLESDLQKSRHKELLEGYAMGRDLARKISDCSSDISTASSMRSLAFGLEDEPSCSSKCLNKKQERGFCLNKYFSMNKKSSIQNEQCRNAVNRTFQKRTNHPETVLSHPLDDWTDDTSDSSPTVDCPIRHKLRTTDESMQQWKNAGKVDFRKERAISLNVSNKKRQDVTHNSRMGLLFDRRQGSAEETNENVPGKLLTRLIGGTDNPREEIGKKTQKLDETSLLPSELPSQMRWRNKCMEPNIICSKSNRQEGSNSAEGKKLRGRSNAALQLYKEAQMSLNCIGTTSSEKEFHEQQQKWVEQANGWTVQSDLRTKVEVGELRANLQNASLRNQSSDVTVIVGNERFEMHKILLRHESGYFRDVIHDSPEKVEIEVSGVPIFHQLYEWFYTEQLPLNYNNLSALFNCAKSLDISGVVDLCRRFLEDQLQCFDAFQVLSSVQKEGNHQLLAFLKDLINEKFLQIISSPYYVNFTCKQVYQLLDEENIGIESERQVFDAAVHWLNYDWIQRKCHVGDIMDSVRIGLLSSQELLDCTHNPLYQKVLDSEQCNRKLIKALLYHEAQRCGEEHIYSHLKPKPRNRIHLEIKNRFEAVGFLYAGGAEEAAAIVIQAAYRGYKTRKILKTCGPRKALKKDYLNIDSSENQTGTANLRLQQALRLYAMNPYQCLPTTSLSTSSQPCILVLGGLDPTDDWHDPNAGVRMFALNPPENNWREVGRLPTARHHAGVAVLKGMIYVVGGCNPNKSDDGKRIVAERTVFVLDSISGQWNEERSMLCTRVHHCTVAAGEKLFSIGGMDDCGNLRFSVESFDPVSKIWCEMAPLNVARLGAAAEAFNGKVWVCGGITTTYSPKRLVVCSEVECYHPTWNSWTILKPLRFPRSFASLVAVQGGLYLIGGGMESRNNEETFLSSLTDIDQLRESTGQWIPLGKLNCARHSASCVAIDTDIYVIGGVSSRDLKAMSSVECFNVDERTHKCQMTSLPVALSGMGCVLLPSTSPFLHLVTTPKGDSILK